jgi:demethylmenaquinone methyltransferase/2-methoxy-6-polyprenyl-1,4-benzoquinol methylase
MEVKTKVSRPLQEIYVEIADGYEAANRVLTMGFDRGWRRRAARRAAAGGGTLWLDVCSGTGEMARDLSRLAPTGTRLVALDFSWPMLSRARTKAMEAPTRFALGEAAHLPFPDGLFDLITISFATRNINFSRKILSATFREFLRVLKPGGRFMNIETSQPRNSLVRGLFHLYCAIIVRRVGRRLSGSRSGYAYLAASMRNFYAAGELSAILRTVGFASVSAKRLLLGVAAIHLAHKPGVSAPESSVPALPRAD